MKGLGAWVILLSAAATAQAALGPDEVALIAVATSPTSRELAEYYAKARGVPRSHIYLLDVKPGDDLGRTTWEERTRPAILAWPAATTGSSPPPTASSPPRHLRTSRSGFPCRTCTGSPVKETIGGSSPAPFRASRCGGWSRSLSRGRRSRSPSTPWRSWPTGPHRPASAHARATGSSGSRKSSAAGGNHFSSSLIFCNSLSLHSGHIPWLNRASECSLMYISICCQISLSLRILWQ